MIETPLAADIAVQVAEPEPVVDGSNYVLNPTFTPGLSGYAGGAATITHRTDGGAFGPNYARATGNVANNAMALNGPANIPVTPGEPFAASVYMRSPHGVRSGYVRVSWTGAAASTGVPVLIPATWQRFTLTGIVPAGATLARLDAWASGGASGQTMDVDAFQYEKRSTVGDFVAGDMTNTDDHLYAWSGSVGASISLRLALWRDLDVNLVGVSVDRGQNNSGATDTLEVGSGSLELVGAIDLGVDPALRPNGTIRIRHKLTFEAAFTGTIIDVNQAFSWGSDGKRTVHTSVAVADAVQSLANTPRYGVIAPAGGRQTWAERIVQLNESATVNVTEPPDNTLTLYSWPSAWPLLWEGSSFDGWSEQTPGDAANGMGLSTISRVGKRELLSRIQNPSTHPITGTPLNVAQNTYGIKRTFTGLTPGLTYSMTMNLAVYMDAWTETENARWWRIQVDGMAWSAEARFSQPANGSSQSWPLATLQFTATATSHIIRLTNARAFSLAPQSFSVVECYIEPGTFSELGIPDDYLLQDVVYESSLLNHYQLACDSVGARFWVDADNTVQFRRAAEETGLVATFTDETGDDDELHYIAVDVSYDTRSVVNTLDMKQHGRALDGDGEGIADDYSQTVTDTDSLASWGERASSLDTCLWVGFEHELDVQSRAREVFNLRSVPGYQVTHVRWNAAENLAYAFLLDVGSRVLIRFDGTEQRSRISRIKHSLSGKRWMMDIWFTDNMTGPTFDAWSDYATGLTFDQLSDIYTGQTFDMASKRPIQ